MHSCQWYSTVLLHLCGKWVLVFILYIVTYATKYTVSGPTRFNPLNSAVSLNNISISSSFLREDISSPLQISAGEGFLREEVQSLLRTNGAHKNILMLISYSKKRTQPVRFCAYLDLQLSLIDRLQHLVTTVCLFSA